MRARASSPFLIVWLFSSSLACSTVDSRIRHQQKEFDSYPEPIQKEIRAGKIEPGFSEDMVLLSQGKPDRIGLEKRDGNLISVWTYLRPKAVGGPDQGATGLSSPYAFPEFGMHPSVPAPMVYRGAGLVVEFLDGRVLRWRE